MGSDIKTNRHYYAVTFELRGYQNKNSSGRMCWGSILKIFGNFTTQVYTINRSSWGSRLYCDHLGLAKWVLDSNSSDRSLPDNFIQWSGGHRA